MPTMRKERATATQRMPTSDKFADRAPLVESPSEWRRAFAMAVAGPLTMSVEFLSEGGRHVPVMIASSV